MEVDETVPNFPSDTFVGVSESYNIQSIENKIQLMHIDNEEAKMDNTGNYFFMRDELSQFHSRSKNIETEELNENAKAFLQLQREREDTTFSRTCLFCKKHFVGNRSLLLDHLTEQHAFFLGQPDNLVYINEFLDVLESMLNKLQCLYCEKIFKDWTALKEHMRKKMHKRINPHNKNFDKFYMCNYVNSFQVEESDSRDAEDDIEIQIGPSDTYILCLFCDNKYSDFDEIMSHLQVVHDFDFRRIRKQFKLCFYSQIKLINYIRSMVQVKQCYICETEFKSEEAFLKHMTTSCHIKILPPQSKWDQPEYFFSTLETDYFLCNLQNDDDEEEEEDEIDDDSNIKIISEDIRFPETSILIDENLRRQLL